MKTERIDELARLEQAVEGARGEEQQHIAECGLQWIDQLLRKNSDYGSSAWQSPALRPGMDPRTAIEVRISDKIARLANLLGGQTPKVQESIEDTMGDLGSYALLWLACPEEVADAAQD